MENLNHLKIDAVANIFNRNNFISSLTWFIIFIVSSSSCIFLIIDAITQFNEHRVTTTVRYLTESEPLLPTITFCNTNPFTSNYSLQLLSYISNANANIYESGTVNYWYQYLQIEAYMKSTRGYYLTNDEKLALSNFDQSIIPLKNVKSFSYERIFHPTYFGCLRFNANGTMKVSTTTDFFQGLLYTGYAIPTVSQINPPNLKGFYLLIQNETDDPFGVERNPIFLTTGLSVKLTISRKFYHQYPSPYSNCGVRNDNSLAIDLPDRQIFDLLIESNYSYTRKACLSLCAQVRTTQVCNCNSNRINYKMANFTDCSLEIELNCAQQNVWNQIESLNAYCSKKCPLECSQLVYDVSFNYGSLSLQDYNYVSVVGMAFWCYYNAIYRGQPVPSADWCKHFLTSSPYLGFFFKDVVQVAIGYESLAYIESQEEPKITGDYLLGQIGGHLNFFLGMSLLSVIEIFELAILFFRHHLFSNNFIRHKDETSIVAGGKVSFSKTFGEIGDRAQLIKIDAFPNAVRSNNVFMFVFWNFLLLVGTGVCAVLIVKSCTEYAEYKVSATVKLKTETDQDDVPRITICNLHPFTTDYTFAYIFNVTRIQILSSHFLSTGNSKEILYF